MLGAGNVPAITPPDVLHKLYAEGQVVLAKMNPVNARLRPHFEEVSAEFTARGWVRFADGGATEGAYLTTRPDVDTIHVTGSERTHDAIVWGAGEEAEERRRADTPVNDKPFTSELGGVSPCIVTPGPWSAADFRFQAEHIVTSKLNNTGHNCVAGQILLVPRDWDGTELLLAEIRRLLRELPPRDDYCPGAADRLTAVAGAHPEAEVYGDVGVAAENVNTQHRHLDRDDHAQCPGPGRARSGLGIADHPAGAGPAAGAARLQPGTRVGEAAHLLALLAVQRFAPDHPLVACRNSDGGMPSMSNLDVFSTGPAGLALAHAGAAPELLRRMCDYLLARQMPDGRWAFGEDMRHSDVDASSYAAACLATVDPVRHQGALERAAGYFRAIAGEDCGCPTYMKGPPEVGMTGGSVSALAWNGTGNVNLLHSAARWLLDYDPAGDVGPALDARTDPHHVQAAHRGRERRLDLVPHPGAELRRRPGLPARGLQ
ncbi:aldehyde dehydrogenase family protein [Streptomyces sp. NPDC097704]|uniref:aldehyde dehydrogenase family protein n=1 Tax=Streptomyces sp. NPDC097704 TaxID=3157101 RepID=UPI0033337098